MPSGQGGESHIFTTPVEDIPLINDTAGTNPIHNKKPKKKPAGEEDEEDKAFKLKQAAGMFPSS